MADLRVLHEARRDLGKEPNLSEKAQGLGVIGDGARQAEKAGIALEDRDPKARQPEQIRRHQPDRAGPDDRDVAFDHELGAQFRLFRHLRFLRTLSRHRLGNFMLLIYVKSTI